MEKLKRVIGLDLLKSIAIVAIVISHLRNVVPIFSTSSFILTISNWIAIIGLSIFFFVSGYSLMLKNPKFECPRDAWEFLRKRFVRIYPLYWMALIIATIVASTGLSVVLLFSMTSLTLPQLIIMISGTQAVFYPQFIHSLGLWWFVSVIMLFYIFFPALIYGANRIRGSFPNSIVLVASIIFSIMVMLQLTLGLFGIYAIYAYYWIFIGGIIVGRQTKLSSIKKSQVLKVCLVSGMCCIILNAHKLGVFGLGEVLPSTIRSQTSVTLIGMIAVSISIFLVNIIEDHIYGKMLQFTKRIAQSTYSIYLFHIYFLTIIAILGASINPGIVAVFVIVIGIPCGIIGPIFIQILFDRFLKVFTNYWVRRESSLKV